MFHPKKIAETDVKNILLIKGHSAGIGDILRSSAAWRALKNKFPQARLHLLFLTKEPGYSSEHFMARHHLLASYRALDKRTQGFKGLRQLLRDAEEFASACQPDLIIDFESAGLRTSVITYWLARKFGAATVGIGEFPLRSLFYNRASVSMKQFCRQRNLTRAGMDYTNRDFVALSALEIERNDTPIELALTEEGKKFNKEFRQQNGWPETTRLVGLNIGCGTPDANSRRPSLSLLASLIAHVQTAYGAHLVLVGAPNESEINQEFLKLLRKNCDAPMVDISGRTSLFELAGLIQACDLFISSDSGPYHISVAVGTPTLAVFNFDFPAAFHHHPWVRCICATNPTDLSRLTGAADELLRGNFRHNHIQT